MINPITGGAQLKARSGEGGGDFEVAEVGERNRAYGSSKSISTFKQRNFSDPEYIY
jgi:hypothetical protein